jgi:hypothetical protein
VISSPARDTPGFCSRDDPSFGFWLRACEGFRVLGPYGRVGRVRGHCYTLQGDVSALIVETGVFRRRTLELDPDEINWILPLGRRVLLDDWASV